MQSQNSGLRRKESQFADFVVHEAAHVFHNCKRFTVGLPETRTKEFLLPIDSHQRETFAYACEVYSRILRFALPHFSPCLKL
jgi:hypothetical protein